MKSLEIQTNKRLLIVEFDLGQTMGDALEKLNIKKDLDIICRGSDLTEEKIRELNIVETKPYGSPPGFCTIAYKYGVGDNGFRPGFCAPNGKQFTNSFTSAIEYAGYYWSKNPFDHVDPENSMYESDLVLFDQDLKRWQDVESRTFHPDKCLIFEIVEG